MKYRLSSSRPAICHNAESRLIEFSFSRELVGHSEDGPDQLKIIVFDIQQRGKMFFGDDQEMDGGLWIDILNGKYVFSVKNFFRGNFPLIDFAKQTIVHSEIKLRVKVRRLLYKVLNNEK